MFQKNLLTQILGELQEQTKLLAQIVQYLIPPTPKPVTKVKIVLSPKEIEK